MKNTNPELSIFCVEQLAAKTGKPAKNKIDALIDVIQAYRNALERKPVSRMDYTQALRRRRYNMN